MNRSKSLLELRPIIKSTLSNNQTSDEETFQNRTLRPIIKFQHDLIITIVEHSINKHCKNFFELSSEKKALKIETVFNTNNQLKNELKGIVIGLFSNKEYLVYYPIKNALNKRIIQIIKERVLSTL